MSNAAKKKKATYSDIVALPDNVIGEIIAGELRTQPRPARRHVRAASSLGGELYYPYGKGINGPGGWVILYEPEVKFGDDIFVPDLSGWRKERLPAEDENNWIDVIPDWVCEVLSPSTATIDKTKKMPLYASAGVNYFWLLDPTFKTLEAYQLRDGQWVHLQAFGGDDIVSVEPFPELRFAISSLWT